MQRPRHWLHVLVSCINGVAVGIALKGAIETGSETLWACSIIVLISTIINVYIDCNDGIEALKARNIK